MRNKSEKQLSIIDAATELISKKGVEKTSLADIARETGISKGTLYYYYPTKNDLIFHITRIHMDRITGDIMQRADLNGKYNSFEKLLTVLFDSILKSETRSRLHLYLIREAISGNEKLQERFRKTYQEWFAMIDQVTRRLGDIDTDILIKSNILVAVIDGFIIQKLIGGEDIDIKGAVRQMLNIFLPDPSSLP